MFTKCIVIFLTISTLHSVEALCDSGWIQNGTKCYYFSTLTAPFYGAAALCSASGAQLAEPLSMEENAFLRDETKKKEGTLMTTTPQLKERGINFFIGIVDYFTESKWVYLSNKLPVEVTNWAPTEPNTLNGIEEDCGEVGTHGLWADVRCDTSRNFICQTDAAYGGTIIG